MDCSFLATSSLPHIVDNTSSIHRDALPLLHRPGRCAGSRQFHSQRRHPPETGQRLQLRRADAAPRHGLDLQSRHQPMAGVPSPTTRAFGMEESQRHLEVPERFWNRRSRQPAFRADFWARGFGSVMSREWLVRYVVVCMYTCGTCGLAVLTTP